MKKIFLGILGLFSFLFLLPFLLFLGTMSTEIGNNTQFQATTPQEKVALEVSNSFDQWLCVRFSNDGR